MKKTMLHPLILMLALAGLVAAAQAQEESVPVSPVSPETFQGWTNAFRLQNALIEVVIAPEVGRLVYLGFKGKDNLLRLDPGLAGKTPDPSQAWNNFGGDWLWPVSQSMWTVFDGKDWPPPAFLAEEPWTGTAWKNSDGSLLCLISRTYGEPLHIKVSRSIRMDNEKAAVTIRQRLERTAPSEIPVCLWNLSQIAQPDEIVFPVDTNSLFETQYRVLNFSPPDTNALFLCDETAVLQIAAGSEYKLGSDSRRAWVAARKGDALIFEKAVPGDAAEGAYPDKGCTIELYSNPGLGYAEIETLSVEKTPDQDESIENELTIECFPIATNLAPCELAAKVRELIGETQPAVAPEETTQPATIVEP